MAVVVDVVLVEVVVVVYNVHTAHADSPRDATDITSLLRFSVQLGKALAYILGIVLHF